MRRQHTPSVHSSGLYRSYGIAPDTYKRRPTTLPQEHEVIKINQLMVVSPRISVILEISVQLKYRHTRPQQRQASTDIREKFHHRQPRSGSHTPHDRLGRVAVGDPDPTADPVDITVGSRKCGFEWADQCSPTLILPWSCTRELGHQGQHLAGTGEWVAALHPQ